jgi:hypothetical protein
MPDSTLSKEKASGWARSAFSSNDLKKLKKAGLLSKATEVVILGDEIVPVLDVGFWVLFISFLY